MTIVVLVVGALTFGGTLAWWKLADRWVDDEHKRFKTKAADDSKKVIVIDEPEPKS